LLVEQAILQCSIVAAVRQDESTCWSPVFAGRLAGPPADQPLDYISDDYITGLVHQSCVGWSAFIGDGLAAPKTQCSTQVETSMSRNQHAFCVRTRETDPKPACPASCIQTQRFSTPGASASILTKHIADSEESSN
jgi:hypothetical protein